MKCEFCEGQTVKRKVNKKHRFQGKLYLIKNVDAEVCRKCGEHYYHSTTLDKIEKNLLQKEYDYADIEAVTI